MNMASEQRTERWKSRGGIHTAAGQETPDIHSETAKGPPFTAGSADQALAEVSFVRERRREVVTR